MYNRIIGVLYKARSPRATMRTPASINSRQVGGCSAPLRGGGAISFCGRRECGGKREGTKKEEILRAEREMLWYISVRSSIALLSHYIET